MAGCRYTWTVELKKEEQIFVSPVFYGGVKDGLYAEWRLRLRLPIKNEGWLLMQNLRCNYASIEVCVNVWFSDHTHQKFLEKNGTFSYSVHNKYGFQWAFPKQPLNHDTLTVCCEIYSIKITGMPLGGITPMNYSMNRFSYMYEKRLLTDTIVAVGIREFHVHKFMLAANSPVFRAMFDHPMKESEQCRVEIQDFDEETVESFIKYIYNGDCPYRDKPFQGNTIETVESLIKYTYYGDSLYGNKQFQGNANQLLAFSEKYDVKELKMKCEAVVADKLDVENAAELLQFADVHRAEGLKKVCLDFVKDNLQQVLPTRGWKSLPRSLVDDFLGYVADALSKITVRTE